MWMTGLKIFLFGQPRLEREGVPLPLARSRALALLAFLCRAKGSSSREALIDLLWPSFSPQDARNNLRRELSILKSSFPDGVIVADRQMIMFHPHSIANDGMWVDVQAFEMNLSLANEHKHTNNELCQDCASHLESAVAIYVDDFLRGFSLPDSPPFDEWQFHEAENLRQSLARALEQLVKWHTISGRNDRALEFARRWSTIDPMDEKAGRALITLYELNGQHAAALRHYEIIRLLLTNELGVEPEIETTQLYDSIRQGRFRLFESTIDSHATPIPVQLPADITPFIGRETEIEQVKQLLTEDTARMISVVGIGGLGKTRLALASARRLVEKQRTTLFSDGVFFVPLAPVVDPSMIANALARALGFTPGGEGEPSQLITAYLKPLKALLIIDNLEHLINQETLSLISDILNTAPGIKLLVTSRVRLGLNGEHTIHLAGLDIGENIEVQALDSADNSPVSDAVSLFVAAARRSNSTFQLNRHNHPIIKRICRLVGGLPLGIELAAAWVELLSPEAIEEEIQRSLDFLASNQVDTPARQASLTVVFDYSWSLLTIEEQNVLTALTVFPGSFDREAAEKIAEASLRTLLAIKNKGWLQSVEIDRYQIHPLLRQYVTQQPEADPNLEGILRDRHADFYCGMLLALDEQMRGAHPNAAFQKITADLDNLMAATMWLVGNNRLEAIVESMAIPLFRYLESSYRYFLFQPLIIEATRRAIVIGHKRIHGIFLTIQGAFFFNNGYPTRFIDYQWVGPEWLGLMRQAWELMPPLRESTSFWDILVAWHYGRFVDVDGGISRLHDIIEYHILRVHPWDEAFARQSLGRLLSRRPTDDLHNSPYKEAGEQLKRAFDMFTSLSDEREAAISLMFMGFNHQYSGELAEAKTILLAAQGRLRAVGEIIIAANINWQLAEIHIQLGEIKRALAYFHEMAETLLRNGLAQLAISSISRESYETVRYDNLEIALILRQRSLALSRQTGEQFNEAWDSWEMAEIFRLMGDDGAAREWNEQSRSKFHSIGIFDADSFYYRLLGDLALAEKDATTAARHFLESVRHAEQSKHPWQRAYGLAGLGTAELMNGHYMEAAALLADSLLVGQSTGDPGGLVLMTFARIARLYKQLRLVEKSQALAELVLNHPLSWEETRRDAAATLELPCAPQRVETTPYALKETISELAAELFSLRISAAVLD